jgi:hypothetical protein
MVDGAITRDDHALYAGGASLRTDDAELRAAARLLVCGNATFVRHSTNLDGGGILRRTGSWLHAGRLNAIATRPYSLDTRRGDVEDVTIKSDVSMAKEGELDAFSMSGNIGHGC